MAETHPTSESDSKMVSIKCQIVCVAQPVKLMGSWNLKGFLQPRPLVQDSKMSMTWRASSPVVAWMSCFCTLCAATVLLVASPDVAQRKHRLSQCLNFNIFEDFNVSVSVVALQWARRS